MKQDQGPSNSWIHFFLENYRVTYLLLIAVVIFGVVAIWQMPKESSPEVDIPVVVVNTALPGAGADSVEELVSRPIEDRVNNIAGINRLNSTSRQGFSTVIIEFEPSSDQTEKMAEVREQVARAEGELPREAETPTVQRIAFDDIPIMRLVLSGPLEPAELKIYAEELQSELEGISNVSEVAIIGAPEREIRVNLRNEDLSRLNLNPEMVIGAINSSDIDLPAGTIETGGREFSLRTDSGVDSVAELRALPVAEREGAIITLAEVADIDDGLAPLNNISRFSIEGKGPQPTVSLQIYKEGGRGDIITIANRAEEISREMEVSVFPEGVQAEVVQSDADLIRSDLRTLLSSGLITIIIIIAILAAFLGWREALLASLVVPFSFLIAFIVIEALGLTVNFLTLFSLILSLGILVDASIVVTESIHRYRRKGFDGYCSALKTIEEFKTPLIAGTLTTVLVFLPMLLLSGITGEFVRSIPITVTAVLLASLFVALAVITTISSRFLPKSDQNNEREKGRYLNSYFENIARKYRDLLTILLRRKLLSGGLLAVMGVAFVAVLALPVVGLVPVDMFPSPDADNIYIDLEAPAGTPLQTTSGYLEPIEEQLIEDPEVCSFLTVVGQVSRAGAMDVTQTGNSHLGGITVTLREDRDSTSQELVEKYRKLFSEPEGAEIRIAQMEAGPTGDSAIRVNLFGPDLDQLEEAAMGLADELSMIEGAENVDSGIEQTSGEFVFRVKREEARRYGLSATDIAGFLRTSISGRDVIDIRINDEDIGVVVKTGIKEKNQGSGTALVTDLSEIEALSILTEKGPVSIGGLTEVKLEPGRNAIQRRDRERVITLQADAAAGYNTSEIVAEFQDRVEQIGLPDGVRLSYGGEVEDIQESFVELIQLLLLGIIMIFALLVWQFSSYRQPVFILVTIPLALIGVIGGLALVGQPLSFPGLIGIVALAGIVVNNAIILIDNINQRRKSGSDKETAVIKGSFTRFRPVILTALTTVLGLVPLAFVSPTWAPVAYSIIFGLLFSTVLTLAVIPVLYLRFARGGDIDPAERERCRDSA